MSDKDNQAAIESLQVKLAFMEDTVEKLSNEFYEQQNEITKLQMINQQLVEKMKVLESHSDSSQSRTIIDEKPPHY